MSSYSKYSYGHIFQKLYSYHTQVLLLAVIIAINIQGNLAHCDAISDNPIVFVTAVPNPRDFGTMAATFGNHIANPDTAFRGGDLWIRYADGTLKNITQSAGYGNSGQQAANSIAVRDPAVHWDGAKVIFSMVVGAPTQQYQLTTTRWQLYEVTGLGANDTPVISKVSGQPSSYNNHSPAYASDDSIIFVSDRPRDDTVLHTYPQRDEYESSPVNSGLWKLSADRSKVVLLDHSPSGDFNPTIDSFGRVIFSRWDHLQRDQQNIGASLAAFNYESETSNTKLNTANEVFPEPRSALDPAYQSKINLFTINQFFPWMANQDGTDLETLNHVGRQEIGLYSERSFNDDPNVQEFYGQYATGANVNDFTIFLHIKEKPSQAGTYIGTSCQEFGSHAAGQIITLNGAPGVNPDSMQVQYLTHPSTSGTSDSPGAEHSGLYRDPLPLTNGKIIVSHTTNTRQDTNIGTSSAPLSRYAFRLKILQSGSPYSTAGSLITSGISKSVSFWNPDQLISYSGQLWELMPVELKARTRPSATNSTLPTIEAQVLSSLDINLADLQTYLREQNLALVVSRNLTSRDKNDRQQPTNLRVTGTNTESVPKSGKVYEISLLQFLQGDLIRGYNSSSAGGRRVIAQPMHSITESINVDKSSSVPGAVQIAEDGSMAAFVPARRALSWQLTSADGTPVVRERYWLTFQPGEVRVCASCHGVNTADHLGNPAPTNEPLALRRLLANWKNLPLPESGSDQHNYRFKLTPTPRLQKNGKFKITLTAFSATQSLYAKIKLANKQCSGRISLNGQSAKRRFKGRFPNTAGKKIDFSLYKSGSRQSIGSSSVTLRGKSQRLAKSAHSHACRDLRTSIK